MTKTNTQLALEAGIHSLSHLRLIEVITASQESIGMTYAAAEVNMSTAAITGAIDRLAELGLAERIHHTTDRRRISIGLTAKGIAFAATLKLPDLEPAFA